MGRVKISGWDYLKDTSVSGTGFRVWAQFLNEYGEPVWGSISDSFPTQQDAQVWADKCTLITKVRRAGK